MRALIRPVNVFLAGFITVQFFTVTIGQTQISSATFKHHFVATDLPGDEVYGYGTPAMADFDLDGDLDYAFCVRRDFIFWFEKLTDMSWQMHTVADLPVYTLGGCAVDVDLDGWPDIVIGGYWYQNPQTPRQNEFRLSQFDASISSAIHDIVAVDINNDNKLDVVMQGDHEGCFWYDIPAVPGENNTWPRTQITLDVLSDNDAIHAGFFPRGIDDLDNDGDVDIVMPDRWYENQQAGQVWQKHDLPFGKRGTWGLSSRSWIVDLDNDQDNDIVIVDADQINCRAAWLENDGAQPPLFSAHFLPLQAPGTRGSFHSLAVADFDLDGDLDIFTVEQEHADLIPQDVSPKWYIWENEGGPDMVFTERIVLDANLGGHDALIGDVDNDGDIDIYSKVWSQWSDNNNNGKEHGDLLENLSDPVTFVHEDNSKNLPAGFSLHQNYPNPFNASTKINFGLPEPSGVQLDIYNVAGKNILTLVDNDSMQAGWYTVTWNGKDRNREDLASGIYLYKLTVGDQILINKMLLIK